MVRRASAAKAWMVVSSESSVPVEKIAAESKTILWYQVFLEGDTSALRAKMDQAVKAGCKAICITAGVPFRNAEAGIGPGKAGCHVAPGAQLGCHRSAPQRHQCSRTDQRHHDARGGRSGDETRGMQGIMVSNYGGLLARRHGLFDGNAAVRLSTASPARCRF